MKVISRLLLLVAMACLPPATTIAETIRVRVMNTTDHAEVFLTGSWSILASNAESDFVADFQGAEGRFLVTRIDQDLRLEAESLAAEPVTIKRVTFTPANTESTMTVKQVPYGVGWWWETAEDRQYQGRFTVMPAPADGRVQGVLELDLEEYIKGVVPGEIGMGTPLEALKVQAIAARTEAVRALRTRVYAGDGYDICADVECQAYPGNNKRSVDSDQAVEETRGLILVGEGKPIGAYYASNCGGCSERVELVWPDRSGGKAWLPAQTDGEEVTMPDLSNFESWLAAGPTIPVYCNPDLNPGLPAWSTRNYRWERVFQEGDLVELAERHPTIGRLKAIEVLERGPSGRAIKARFIGSQGSEIRERELSIRQFFHPPLRSSAFVVSSDSADELMTTLTIKGAGWGHGVGMCQTGAISRALKGQNFRHILGHYYPGAEIVEASTVK
jgi:peptidoglycan hydrolase-like amidase